MRIGPEDRQLTFGQCLAELPGARNRRRHGRRHGNCCQARDRSDTHVEPLFQQAGCSQSTRKAKLSELVDVVDRRDESITITRNGTPVAMIVSAHEYEGWHETSEILKDAELVGEIRRGIRSLARTRKRYSLDGLLGK